MKSPPLDFDPEILVLQQDLRGLRNLARTFFLDRNANGWNRPGMPKGDRLKAGARPVLRQAIH